MKEKREKRKEKREKRRHRGDPSQETGRKESRNRNEGWNSRIGKTTPVTLTAEKKATNRPTGQLFFVEV